MKKLTIILLSFLVISCYDTKQVFSQTWEAAPDTFAVGDTILITMQLEKKCCIEGFAFHLVLDTNQINFVPELTLMNGLFESENINSMNGDPMTNRIIFGFANPSGNNTCIEPGQEIFTIGIYIKDYRGDPLVNNHLENKSINGNNIKEIWRDLEFSINQMFSNIFILRKY